MADECASVRDDSRCAPPGPGGIRSPRSLRPPSVRSSACLRATSSRTIESRYRRRHSLGCMMTCPTMCARAPTGQALPGPSQATDTAIDDGGDSDASTAHSHRSQHLRPRAAVQRTTATLNGHDPIPVGSSVSNVMAIFGPSLHSFPSSATKSNTPSAGTIDADVTSDHHGLLPTSLTFTVRCHVG